MQRDRSNWEFIATDSLEKVFADARPRASEPVLSGFLGEAMSAQLAFLPPSSGTLPAIPPLRVLAEGPLAGVVQFNTVELVPVQMPAFDTHDDGYLRDVPGLYPDLLQPLPADATIAPGVRFWRSLWIDVEVTDEALAGSHELSIVIENATTGEQLHRETFTVTIHPAALPELDIVNTHWLHADCIADLHDVEVLSEEHWQLLDAYIASAAQMRVNSVLTPTWTPPLDTAEGHTRPAVQLIGIRDGDDGYEFSFEALGRWLEICRKHHIRTLEIAHLFTQWGARATPAIYVDGPDGRHQRFGWDVAATDPSYRELMAQLLPQLREYLAAHWDGEVFFHISDEPRASMVDDYRAARAVVDDLLQGATIADALSDFELVSDGTVQTPIVATNHVEPFLQAGQSPWVYYCVSQNRDVSNRFIAMPSVRNRVLGRQLFVAGAPGFLHWGYNFWYSQYSLRVIDPFRDTCSGGGFPGGDPFVVYPGADGRPLLSLRHRVFAQAMDDHRALQLLRDLTDRETAASVVDDGGTLTYSSFSYDPEHYLRTRRDVDALILSKLT